MYYNYSDLNYLNQELAIVWPGWTAVKLLGKGSFGAVYEIHRTVRGNLEKAAMKVLRVPDSDAEVARLRFQGMNHQSTEAYYENQVDGIYNEIRIMQSFIGNSHIVSYEDYAIRKRSSEIGWDIYIRMELLTGLPDYMSRHPMNDQMVFKLGMDIAQGLRDCHNAGIIHRDIKPENIFVNKTGSFKLGDFGVSRNSPGSQDVLSFKGTLGYMAPEVYKMQSTDARSDIYSLGVVLYQCLNDNRLPFVPEDFTPYDIETARQRRLAGEPISAPAHGSRRLTNLVLKAIADRPEDRFQTAEEMYRALRKAYEADYNESVTLYQNTAPQPVKQTTAAPNHYDGNTVRNNTIAEQQGQNYPDPNIQYQNTQYQQPEKKPFPLIHVVVAVAVVLAVIAGAGIFSLFIKIADNSGSGQAAQIAETVQTDQMSQSSDEQPVEENQADNTEVVDEHNDELAEEEFTDYAIDWKDAALEAKMHEITGISSGNIMYSDVKDITELDLSNPDDAADDVKIKDISALSNLKKLTYLNLYNNLISDISVLGGLKNLTVLYLDENQVSDISAIGDLKNLTALFLYSNQISDISTLGGLTNLTRLFLGGNQISDISAIGGLTNLTKLGLSANQISDISAIGGLTNLTKLFLNENQISDISPLSNLTNLTLLNIMNNPIDDYSPIEDLNIEELKK